MEMWLKRSTLVLLTAALVISDQALVILDEKRSTEAVKVPHGSSVTFQCRLKTGAHDTFRVIWYLNPSTFDLHNLSVEFFNKSAKKSRVVSNKTKQDSKEDTEETWPTYTLSNATDQDSGCEERGTYNGSSDCVSHRELHARRPVDVDHVGGFFGHPDCPAGRVCLADKKAPPKQRRSNLRKHSSCGQQAAFSSAGDGPPKGGFFLSKPPEPESRQEVRRRQAEIQIMKKSRINSSSSHLVKACVHCTES
ncbi:uncharacterized protein [Cebidichthys violaceus]|uniref:uncharacterized protein isoform X5 n=1 Tax=Cebidichthys violaceus TaxID=271503 RepID=UPI0035CB2AFB